MNQIDAMKQALEALKCYEGRRAKDILRQAIEQAEKQEPISSILTKWKTGMICGQDAMVLLFRHYSSDPATPTAPAQPAPGNTTCNPHPDAPHGFVRNASIAEDRYVCECEGWMPPAQRPLTDKQVFTLIHTKHFDPKYRLLPSDEVCLNWYRLGIRDGEAVHGIKGEPK